MSASHLPFLQHNTRTSYSIENRSLTSLSSISELSRFIAAGRLNCVIDKVNQAVTTNRPDFKNAQYEQIIKQGDIVLNSIQKLSRTAL